MVHYLNLYETYFLVVTSRLGMKIQSQISMFTASGYNYCNVIYIIVDLPGYGSNDSKKNGTNEEELHVD